MPLTVAMSSSVPKNCTLRFRASALSILNAESFSTRKLGAQVQSAFSRARAHQDRSLDVVSHHLSCSLAKSPQVTATPHQMCLDKTMIEPDKLNTNCQSQAPDLARQKRMNQWLPGRLEVTMKPLPPVARWNWQGEAFRTSWSFARRFWPSVKRIPSPSDACGQMLGAESLLDWSSVGKTSAFESIF